MRNRTELVTTTLPGSENEEDASDLEDSEEDWKPSEKKKGAAAAGKVAKTSPKAPAKRKAAAASTAGKGKGKAAPKKVKKEESDDDDDDFEDEEDEDELDDDEDDEEVDAKEDKKKTKNGTSTSAAKGGSGGGGAKGKPGMANNKSFPDKDGKFELFLFKNDLAKDFRNDPKLCMWRRDGSSLLQKYIKVKDEENKVDVFFTSSSVYSCWEEKRKNDFFQIKVQCVGDKKEGKVKVVDVDELAKFAAEDRPQVETKPQNPAPADNGGEDEEDCGEDEEDEEEDEDVEEEE